MHNHNPDRDLKDKLELRQYLKTKASSTNEKFQKIFLDGQEQFPDAAGATGGLPQYKSMLYRARGKRFGKPPVDLSSIYVALSHEGNER